MRYFKLTIAYDGSGFHGWQRQPELRTVQHVLDTALEQLTGTRPRTLASSRTDGLSSTPSASLSVQRSPSYTAQWSWIRAAGNSAALTV